MFRVGIIIPSWHYFDDPFKLQPLHELYYATVIDHEFDGKDIGVSVIDLRQIRAVNKIITPEVISILVAEQELFLYWVMKTADYLEVLDIVKILKELYPNSKHVAGGTHITYFQKECQEYFDAVIPSSGEKPFFQIINRLWGHGKIDNVYMSEWDSSKFGDYPYANRGYLPKKSIVNRTLFEKYGKVLGTSVMFSRGCNFDCKYCVYNMPNVIQFSQPPAMEKEINYLKSEYKIEAINLRDEICIPMIPKVAFPFLEAIGNCNVIWRGQTRVGIKYESVKLAAETGCKELAIGVESADNEVRNIVEKRATFDQIKKFIDWSHELDIKIKLCLILGLPGEPENIVTKTIEFIQNLNPDFVAVSGFCPVPGSVIYNCPEYFGIKKIYTDWNQHAHLMHRFSDEEDHGIPFEYEKINKWGETFSREQIIENIKEVQNYLRQYEMSY